MQQTVTLPFKPGAKVLEVGGGDSPLFHPNLDMRKLVQVDIVADIEDRWPVEDGSFEGVFSKFCIEHCSWRKVPHFASECCRVLKPGGLAYMVAPNTLEQCREVARLGKVGIEENSLLYGGQEERGWNEHKAAFSPEYAVKLFKDAGFERVEIKEWPGQIWTGKRTDMIIMAYKGGTVAAPQTQSQAPQPQPQQAQPTLAQQPWYQEMERKMTESPKIVTERTEIANPRFKRLGLNVGSFTVMMRDAPETHWTNIDILDLSAYATQHGFDFKQLDARKGIPWPDHTVDYLVAFHFLEHITRQEGAAFLKECLRVLKVGGVIRIGVPDTELIASTYVPVVYDETAPGHLKSAPSDIKKDFGVNEGVKNAEDEAEAFWNFLTAGHLTAYDAAALIAKLQRAGFGGVVEKQQDESYSSDIQLAVKGLYNGTDMVKMPGNLTLYVEGRKPDDHAKAESSHVAVSERTPPMPTSTDKLRVGILSTQFFGCPPQGYSGLERVVWDLAVALGQRGHYVRLFAPDGSHPPPNGQVVFTGPALSTVNVDWVKAEQDGWNIAKAHINDLQILHGNNWFGFEYLAKAQNPNLKVTHTHHGHLNPEWWLKSKPPYKLNFIAISKWMQAAYRQQGMESEYAYNGIDMGKYKFKAQKGNRLLWVGRLDTFKRPHVAIEIAKRLGIPLDIFGGSFVQDPKYLEQIKAMCDGKQVVMHLDASQEEKVRYMQDAMCLLFPSKMGEPFGLVATEAMACGTPVVASADGAISEVVADGVTGYVRGIDDIDAMAEAVKQVGSIKPQDCRRRVEELFSREKMAERYEELYRRILGEGAEW